MWEKKLCVADLTAKEAPKKANDTKKPKTSSAVGDDWNDEEIGEDETTNVDASPVEDSAVSCNQHWAILIHGFWIIDGKRIHMGTMDQQTWIFGAAGHCK